MPDMTVLGQAEWWRICLQNWAELSKDWKKSVFPVHGGTPYEFQYPEGMKPCLPRARGLVVADLSLAVVSSPCAGVHRPHTRRELTPSCVFPVRGGPPSMLS